MEQLPTEWVNVNAFYQDQATHPCHAELVSGSHRANEARSRTKFGMTYGEPLALKFPNRFFSEYSFKRISFTREGLIAIKGKALPTQLGVDPKKEL